jgi:plasmid stability protein
MATLHVRNVPEDLYERLRRRAQEEGRSINAETIELLRPALAERDRVSIEELLAQAERFRATQTPDPDAPTAVEMIREDRER